MLTAIFDSCDIITVYLDVCLMLLSPKMTHFRALDPMEH